MVLLEMQKKTVVFDKPTYTGFTILELSKCRLYELIYEVIKPNFPNTVLAYVDTDSCIFETSEDPYEILKNNEHVSSHFDLSVYPPDFKAYNPINKGVLGTFKDENASFKIAQKSILNVITEFTALR